MFIGIGALFMLVCVIWFVVLSIQMGGSTGEKVIWAIANFFFQPIAGIIFFFVKKAGLIPMVLGILGVLMYGYGWFTSMGDVMRTIP